VHEFVQNSVFSARSARFAIFALGTPLFSGFFSEGFAILHFAHHFLAIFSEVDEFVQKSVFSPISARFVTGKSTCPSVIYIYLSLLQALEKQL